MMFFLERVYEYLESLYIIIFMSQSFPDNFDTCNKSQVEEYAYSLGNDADAPLTASRPNLLACLFAGSHVHTQIGRGNRH